MPAPLANNTLCKYAAGFVCRARGECTILRIIGAIWLQITSTIGKPRAHLQCIMPPSLFAGRLEHSRFSRGRMHVSNGGFLCIMPFARHGRSHWHNNQSGAKRHSYDSPQTNQKQLDRKRRLVARKSAPSFPQSAIGNRQWGFFVYNAVAIGK